MNNKNLHLIKKEYLETPIPDKLDSVVNEALRKGRENNMKRKNIYKRAKVTAASVAVSTIIFTAAINSSPTFAETLSKVPVMGEIVKVLTFKEYTFNEDKINVDIQVPSIQGLDDKKLESSLNEKYLEENRKLYETLMDEINELKQNGEVHLSVESGYDVITDTDDILSIKRYVFTAAGSSDTKIKYDTIDKNNQILITLPSLFKDDSYIEVISNNIITQMKEQMESDEGIVYWVDGAVEYLEQPFKEISKDQNFYINNENKLVISFDKYEAAPGYMGVLEFVIPTEILSDILISNEYLK